MDLGLKDKIAMVAAGTRGIGLACAQALAREGAKVSVCGVTPDHIERTARELGSAHRAYRCDLSRASDIEAWYRSTEKELGAPDILVTNTGGPPAGSAAGVDEDKWRAGFESTLLNVVRLTALAAPAMKRSGWGRIVHLTSLVAKDPEPMLAISSTLRAGLSALCRLQARELGPSGITVNCILPGHTETDRQTHLLELKAKEQQITLDAAREHAALAVPLRRLAQPEEIGDVVAFVCSERASYLSGAQILVDGAATRGLG